MKVKRVTIGVRPPGAIFEEAEAVIRQIEAETQPEWLYFPDVRAMGKVLTPKRLELLRTIREAWPESVRALSQITGRHIKNVADDLHLLTVLGLVEMKTSQGPGRKKAPRVGYEPLMVEVPL